MKCGFQIHENLKVSRLDPGDKGEEAKKEVEKVERWPRHVIGWTEWHYGSFDRIWRRGINEN